MGIWMYPFVVVFVVIEALCVFCMLIILIFYFTTKNTILFNKENTVMQLRIQEKIKGGNQKRTRNTIC